MKDIKLVTNLAKNDFKVKYAGSYFGVFWAFFQPIIQILIFWFVFQVGFQAGPVKGYPYVLWLIAGMIPWFFFSDSLTSVTNCFIEYSFLVKKVVFNINILPIVKVISSSYVHIFFIILMIFIYAFNGFMPDIYYVQILYYLLCSFLLILSIAYLTSSIVIFFKDLNQIVLISLQVLNWLTPIMWNYEMVSEKYRWVLQLNPLYYIISGYRDTFINKVWFYQHPINTLYFLSFCVISILISKKIYFKLKPHFSDVL